MHAADPVWQGEESVRRAAEGAEKPFHRWTRLVELGAESGVRLFEQFDRAETRRTLGSVSHVAVGAIASRGHQLEPVCRAVLIQPVGIEMLR